MSNITNCFWDTETSGQTTSAGGGTGKTTYEMSQQATFTGWDFTSIWSIDEGSSYPYFQLQNGLNKPLTTDYTLTAGNDGNGTATGGGDYLGGQSVTITATPSTGYKFKNWTTSGSGSFADANSASTTFTMPGEAVTITANFEPDFAGGDGTSENPFQISTPAHLNNVRYFLTSYFILNNDINLDHATLSAESWYDSTNGWLPIGDLANKFAGSYDGGGYTISNLFIDRNLTDYVGLFGWIDTCPGISNLGLLSVDITGQNNVGALVGYSNAVTGISKCYSSGSITGNNYGGGLIGYICDNVLVSNCYSTATVSTPSRSGGFAGHIDNTELTNCFATGALTASPGNAFGISGSMLGYTTNNCFYDSDTTGVSNVIATETPKTTVEMSQQATFTGWDFTTIWNIDGSTNNGYPFLR